MSLRGRRQKAESFPKLRKAVADGVLSAELVKGFVAGLPETPKPQADAASALDAAVQRINEQSPARLYRRN